MKKSAKIYVAGHGGLVGSAIVRKLHSLGYENLLLRTRKELDLTIQKEVVNFFATEKPEFVILAAAKVGGILANSNYPADFIYANLVIAANVIHAAYKFAVQKLLFLGSSCIYPKFAAQPIKEEYLLTGPLEPTNQPYAIAKIAGVEMCHAYNKQYGTKFIPVMPTNLYGPNDNFDLENSHVLPALIRKFYEAAAIGLPAKNSSVSAIPVVNIWGDGTARREFLHVDDLADACIFLMNIDDSKIIPIINSDIPTINIGSGNDISIAELVKIVSVVAHYTGTIEWDRSKPNGTPRKLLDVSKIKSLGWAPKIGLLDGIRDTYDWYSQNKF